MKPGFLSYDSKLIYTLNKLVDLIIAGLLWLLCSLPLVTIGASSAALYYTTVKVVRRDRSKVTREFFRSFRVNLKHGILSTLLFTAVGAILYVYTWFLDPANSTGFSGMLYFFSVLMSILLYSITVTFYYPVLSRFQMTFWQLLRLSFVIAIRNLGWALLAALIAGAGILLIYLNFGFLVLVPALVAYFSSFIVERVLRKYMPRDAVGADDWYFEDSGEKPKP